MRRLTALGAASLGATLGTARGTMVKLNKIYTRTGDAGTTASAPASALPSTICASPPTGRWTRPMPAVGLVRHAYGGGHTDLDAKLERIQNDLFDLGADLCVPDRGEKLGVRAAAHNGRRSTGWSRDRLR